MKKKTTKRTVPKKNTATVVEVKDFWFNSKIRESARDLFGNHPTVTAELHKNLLTAMFAKRECRRMSESEGGSKPGKLFKNLSEAQTVLADTLAEIGMSLIEAKQLSRSVVVSGQRLFDMRHESETAK